MSSRANRKALRLGANGVEEELEPRLLAVADRFGPTPEIAEYRRVRALTAPQAPTAHQLRARRPGRRRP